jgi:hypothetical protein
MQIPDDLHLSERGNILLTGDDGNMVAWLTLEGDRRLEVTFNPGNYPALNVGVVTLTDEQLAAHINGNLGGWHVRKCNIEGVNVENGYVAEEKR